jgi:hypothetical protein
MPEIRERIGDCRTDVPAGVTDWRFTGTEVPAPRRSSVIRSTSPQPDYPTFQSSVAACDLARAGAVVVHACALATTESPVDGRSSTLSRGSDLRVLNRNVLDPLIARARELEDL